MTQNTEQNVRTRDDQVDDLFLELSKGSVILGRASVAEAHIAEAEARGAAEERGKAAEGQEPVAFQILHHATWREAIPANEAYWTSRGYKVRRLYTHPANVAALEARVKELEEAIEDYFDARAGCEVECVSRTGEPEQRAKREARNDLRIAFERKISAALKREGGVLWGFAARSQ